MVSINSNKAMNEFPLLSLKEGIPLFYPFIAPEAFKEVENSLNSRWIGQGPKVDLFEEKFKEKLCPNNFPIAVGSGTDGLHLAYLLAGIKEGDEVISPVFTCTATNLPILYIKAKPVFADVDPLTMNINVNDIEKRITNKTKAIVAVDYGGIPADYERLSRICKKHNLKLIGDCAQSIGTLYRGKPISEYCDYSVFSFQAIKTITTSDGGMLVLKNDNQIDEAKRLRWFGIDRSEKQKGTWENDIYEIGFKYQMNDISACLGISGLNHLEKLVSHRKLLMDTYKENISNSNVRLIYHPDEEGTFVCPWLCTLIVKEGRIELMNILRKHGVESAQVHYRNDRYKVFGQRKNDLPNMDFLEDKYLVLPIHHKISINQAEQVSRVINNWIISN